MSVKKRVQLNLQIRQDVSPIFANLTQKNQIIPLMWIEEAGDIDEKNAQKLKDQAIIPKKVGTIFLFIMWGLGGVEIVLTGFFLIYNKIQ